MDTVNIEDIYPLSPVQEGMLFHTLYAPTSGVYVEQLVAHLTGFLDEAAFRRAWQETVQHHPVLRTAFVWKLDKPMQVVLCHVAPLITIVTGEDVEMLVSEDRRQGFDFSEPPLMRITLVRHEDSSHHLVWSYHHLLLDGWSTSLVVREVLTRYGQAVRGEAAHFSAIPGYREFIAWTQRQDTSAMEHFWRAELSGLRAAPLLELDGVSPRTSGEGDQFAETRATLSAEHTAVLLNWAREQRLTPNTVLAGAWASLLGMHLDTPDVALGVIVACRPPDLPQAEQIIGPFVNTLLLRAPAPDVELTAWLRALQDRQIRAQEYSHTPLSKVQSFTSIPPGQPLFETVLVYENYPVETSLEHAYDGGLAVSGLRMFERTHYPLTLIAVPGQHLELRLNYDRHRFTAADSRTLLDQVLGLLKAMPVYAGTAAALPFRLAAENPRPPQPTVLLATVNARFRAQVAHTPEAQALSWEGVEVTYRELARRRTEIALALLAAGIKRGDRVAILADEGAQRIGALLAVLEAGAAFVALDPTYPESRLQKLIDDADPSALVIDETTAPMPIVARYVLGPVIALPVAPVPGHDAVEISPGDAAYLAYTSGSTGRPKGVVQPHRAFCQYLDWQSSAMSIGRGARIAQWASISYDAAYAEIFGALGSGATLCLASASVRHDPVALVEWLRAERITHLWVVPSFLRQLLPFAGEFPDLQVLMLAGEVLGVDLARSWLESAGGRVRLYNLYGPTECVLASAYLVKSVTPGQRAIPIGRAFVGRELLLIRDGRPCPVGVRGEIFIRSRFLSKGYFRRPEETSRAFLQDPVRHDFGDPVYRTGDIGRRLPDGNLEFLGRRDLQVKVRGMRVEIEEIESAILRHPGVAECAVALRQFADSDERLVAWVGSPCPPTVESLRAHLAGLLPHFMVPSRFVFVERLPRTESGKLQRVELPALEAVEIGGQEPPVGELEAQIARLLAELLMVARVGRGEDFFAMGGHSLLALQAINRLRDAFSVEIALRDFFARPTVAGLAELVDQAGGRRHDPARFSEVLDEVRTLSHADVREQLDGGGSRE